MKTCNRCSESKPLDQFYRHSGHTDGRRSSCRACDRARDREYHQKNKDAILARKADYYVQNGERVRALSRANNRARQASDPEDFAAKRADQRLRRKYGITLAERDAMLSGQGDACAICAAPEPVGNGWHVDHDHSTGAVRGVLCQACNVGLGHFKDNPMLLQRAIQYVQQHAKERIA